MRMLLWRRSEVLLDDGFVRRYPHLVERIG